MIDMQILGGVLAALAVLIGAAVVLSAALLAAATAPTSGQAPPGGIRRDVPQHPQPDSDDARVLVLS